MKIFSSTQNWMIVLFLIVPFLQNDIQFEKNIIAVDKAYSGHT